MTTSRALNGGFGAAGGGCGVVASRCCCDCCFTAAALLSQWSGMIEPKSHGYRANKGSEDLTTDPERVTERTRSPVEEVEPGPPPRAAAQEDWRGRSAEGVVTVADPVVC
jgi:hypothetical protein